MCEYLPIRHTPQIAGYRWRDEMQFQILTVERLKGALRYEPETGNFIWRKTHSSKAPAGSIAGTIRKAGYRIICVDQVEYTAARLAWFYTHGEWPQQGMVVDHINCNRSDNRIANLRLADRSQNLANSMPRKNKPTAKGVHYHKKGKLWTAQISVYKRSMYLGSFKSQSAAAAAYSEAAQKFYGQFARVK